MAGREPMKGRTGASGRTTGRPPQLAHDGQGIRVQWEHGRANGPNRANPPGMVEATGHGQGKIAKHDGKTSARPSEVPDPGQSWIAQCLGDGNKNTWSIVRAWTDRVL